MWVESNRCIEFIQLRKTDLGGFILHNICGNEFLPDFLRMTSRHWILGVGHLCTWLCRSVTWSQWESSWDMELKWRKKMPRIGQVTFKLDTLYAVMLPSFVSLECFYGFEGCVITECQSLIDIYKIFAIKEVSGEMHVHSSGNSNNFNSAGYYCLLLLRLFNR